MKRGFTMYIEDGCEIIGLQIGVAVRRKEDGEKGVTFFSLSEGSIEGNDEYLFKVNGKADRIHTGDPRCKLNNKREGCEDYCRASNYTCDMSDYCASCINSREVRESDEAVT